jgi:Ca2+-transporting ATPase
MDCMLNGLDISICLCISASMIGLDTIHSQVLSGDQMDSMPEHQLEHMVGSVSVFYRVTPRHKLCIVKVSF